MYKTKQKLEKCDGVQVVPTEGEARLPTWNFFGFFYSSSLLLFLIFLVFALT